jgi:hypothetical protein
MNTTYIEFVSELDGIDLIEVNWKRGIFNQIRDVKLAFLRAGYRLFGEIKLENRQWEGEIVAKGKGDVVRFHVV